MIKKIKNIFGYILRPKTSKCLSLMNNGYLKDIGWINSEKAGLPVDANNNPLTWYSYSHIQFTAPYITKEISIFEFGAGYSTLYYSSKVKKVTSIDYNINWINILRKKIPDNVVISHYDLGKGYENAIKQFNKTFYIIIIDGKNRKECIKNSIENINKNGLFTLDTPEREHHRDEIPFLKKRGYKKIDFWGITQGYIHNKYTTIFSKDFNSFLS